jgi:hypothetical protein
MTMTLDILHGQWRGTLKDVGRWSNKHATPGPILAKAVSRALDKLSRDLLHFAKAFVHTKSNAYLFFYDRFGHHFEKPCILKIVYLST